MKKNSFICFVLSLCLVQFVQAQSSIEKQGVEHALYGVQTGLLGVWVFNEARLSNSLALRTEIGLEAGMLFYASNLIGDVGTVTDFSPSISLEPRWYYNLDERFKEGRPTKNNSGNYWGFKIDYDPDWFVISNSDQVEALNLISFIPKWGIKRSFSEHFTYGLSAGLGYVVGLGDHSSVNGLVPDFQLRIGYTF